MSAAAPIWLLFGLLAPATIAPAPISIAMIAAVE